MISVYPKRMVLRIIRPMAPYRARRMEGKLSSFRIDLPEVSFFGQKNEKFLSKTAFSFKE